MDTKKCKLGLIGLGTMGRNLLLNMADSGFAVAGYDVKSEQVDALSKEAEKYDITAVKSIEEFIVALEKPRAVLLLVPAGKVVDIVIDDLLPHLDAGDLIIDGGNSHFPDTKRRQAELKEKGINLLGLGVSGGAKGARIGPSMMPGGEQEAYDQVKGILEAVSAKVDGDPCITYLGKGSVGHYVKMVHNGIEYGMMQLIAEIYSMMKTGLQLKNSEIAKIFHEWNQGELESYLLEITAKIFEKKNETADEFIIDTILDSSKSKGTGKWTSQDAMDIGAPIPNIDVAVSMRYMSALKEQRVSAKEKLVHDYEMPTFESNDEMIEQLRKALYFGFVTTYAQGMSQLLMASEEYSFELDMEAVARIWRGGCIIRANLLEVFRTAFKKDPALINLMVDGTLAQKLNEYQIDMREVVKLAVTCGIPITCLMASLGYYDSYRTERLPANLIQAQRDFFGSHTYQRINAEGVFHTDWD